MRNILFFLLLALSSSIFAQQRKYTTFYEQRASLFECLEHSPQDIIFLGNSITNGGEWAELFHNSHIKNRGISGDTSEGVYDRLDPILKGKPAKLFLLIGINDVANGVPSDTIVWRIGRILERIKKESPQTKIYLQSIFPVNDEFKLFTKVTGKNDVVNYLNGKLALLAKDLKVTYIDVHSSLVDKQTGKLNAAYTNDGLHLMGKGYVVWKKILERYVR